MSSVHWGSGDTIEAHHIANLISPENRWANVILQPALGVPPLSNVTETETCEELE
jgi:hypothetical protein